MKKFLFVDLDDTLFQTLKKCRAGEDLRPVGYLRDGSAISFTTARQRAFFEMVQREMTLIPATARNRDAFGRVDLPFSSHAVVDYGGLLLGPDRIPDAAWMEVMRPDMEAARAGLVEAMARIDHCAEAAGQGGRARLVEDCGIPFYAMIKDPDGDCEHLAHIERTALVPWVAGEGRDFYIHRNGNNLALLPNSLNKARAVAHLQQRLRREHGEIICFGMGDSRSDARFMAACDYAIVPTGTQLAALTLEAL